MKPAGPHSTPQGLFVTSGCRGRGDRLTGHHANITLPTWGEGRGWGSPATFGSLVSEWLVYLLGHLPKDPCCWPSHKLQGPLWERILLDFCFLHDLLHFCLVKQSLGLRLSLPYPECAACRQGPGCGRGIGPHPQPEWGTAPHPCTRSLPVSPMQRHSLRLTRGFPTSHIIKIT